MSMSLQDSFNLYGHPIQLKKLALLEEAKENNGAQDIGTEKLKIHFPTLEYKAVAPNVKEQ